ncbi:nucleotidyltransferase domain-containing protein [Adhaeribacter arboris]|nr:nucleotidyltransferase domain-containing protein [Adhaeribacter arboris]
MKSLCEQHCVRSLFAFGSVTNDRFKVDSDIDLVIDIDAPDPLRIYRLLL